MDQVEVVLIEDNPLEAELVERTLKDAGLANRLVWLEDGQDALDFIFCKGPFANRRPDVPELILLDLNMPKVGGIEVLRAVRADSRTRHIPVVVLTSSSNERDMAESYHLGVNSYLMKPVDFNAFADIVRRVGYQWLAVRITS